MYIFIIKLNTNGNSRNRVSMNYYNLMNYRAVNHIKNQIKSCSLYKDVYNYINPVITDVSLRDGIQGLTPELMTTEKKQIIFQHIHDMKFVSNIEIGSIVSHKHMPVMKDVPNLYQSCIQYIESKDSVEEMIISADKEIEDYYPNIFTLIPNMNKLKVAEKHAMTNYAFVTSVSNSFQERNINRSLQESNTELYKMQEYLKYKRENNISPINTKLYISCIDHCPYEGKIKTEDVVTHIVNHACTEYYNEVCLSDTCGSLTFNSYRSILDECLKYINPNMISLHLHVNKNNHLTIENIIRYSLNKGVHRFDVSLLEHGGCSMTLKDDDKYSNLDYILLCKILDRYIKENVERLRIMEREIN